jgi:tRNA nucleotidyltransferase (CCA-adding enzyme)
MQLILTHEQADFDAVGALAAAHLLYSSALPVLPRKLNQNVRRFINLYGSELPFVETAELPGDPIDGVILVDTQSLITLKNLRKEAAIHVVDHHVEKTNLPEHWLKTIAKVGATTSILVNQLKELNVIFTPTVATLMLLGIYEDTGSLMYASTTVQDVYATAFLLEKGADLRILSDYLNSALTPGQLAVADELLNNARLLPIHGKKVLLSHATALDMEEEISGIAHKIRDLLDPDALFLLVHTREGVRLVARSTSDEIDVSQVANLFGGGGHARAAAALMHPDDPHMGNPDVIFSEATNRILEHLNKSIKPAVTVGKIMSKKPLLITRNTSLKEALEKMKRYGYEGYPVVEGKQVVGLLTRRAVDRASTHKLELTAGSLMDAGNVSLLPDQTLEEVQDLMASTGWGQIPVIDPSSKEIVGIVTRTDLLKNLRKLSPMKSSTVNYAQKIENALTPGRLALLRKVIEVANMKNMPVYTVGGFVRDLLLDLPSHDFDIVIEGDAVRIAQELSAQFGGRVVSHRRFGTSKWQIREIRPSLAKALEIPDSMGEDLPEFLDLISARTEFYDHPTALPTVERSNIKLDLHRRDFTINTLALRLDRNHYGELYDHWGGLNDLHNKKIRVLHSLSFVDDPTRLLRAVRFEQRFQFQIEARTLQLMDEARPMLRQVSGDRLRHEFDLVFNETDPCRIMARMMALDLLTPIHPQLQWNQVQDSAIPLIRSSQIEPGWKLPPHVGNIPLELALHWSIWMTGLPLLTVQEISSRFKFPAPLAAIIKATAELLPTMSLLPGMKPSGITAQLESFPEVSLYTTYLYTYDQNIRNIIITYIQKWKNVQPQTNGDDLRNAGLLPGPAYKNILTALRSAYLDGEITTKAEEKHLLTEILAQEQ